MVESFRRHCKLAVEANPLEPVAQIYEEQIAVMKRDFAAANEELLEFEGLVPNFNAMAPSLYRWSFKIHSKINTIISSWRSKCLPPTPPTQIEFELDTRFLDLFVAITCNIILIIIRFTRDDDDRLIVLGDYQFPDEPNGRVLLFGRWNLYMLGKI